MKNKIVSLMLGSFLGLLAGQEAWKSQYLRYYPQKEEYKLSDLVFSEKTDQEVMNLKEETVEESFEPLIGTEAPEAESYIVRSDTLLYYDEDIPYDVQESAQICGNMYDICPEFLEAIAFVESSYIPTAENGSCVGLMQINLDCSEQIERMEKFGLHEEDMYDIDASMIVAADYLYELFEDYKDPAEVLIRYNGDKTGLKRYKKTGEISDYAKKVLELSEQLERKHGK